MRAMAGVTAIKVNTVIERAIVESSFERMAKSPEQGLAEFSNRGATGSFNRNIARFASACCESDEALDVGPREFNRKLIFPSHWIA